jgi:hypothetical protein
MKWSRAAADPAAAAAAEGHGASAKEQQQQNGQQHAGTLPAAAAAADGTGPVAAASAAAAEDDTWTPPDQMSFLIVPVTAAAAAGSGSGSSRLLPRPVAAAVSPGGPAAAEESSAAVSSAGAAAAAAADNSAAATTTAAALDGVGSNSIDWDRIEEMAAGLLPLSTLMARAAGLPDPKVILQPQASTSCCTEPPAVTAAAAAAAAAGTAAAGVSLPLQGAAAMAAVHPHITHQAVCNMEAALVGRIVVAGHASHVYGTIGVASSITPEVSLQDAVNKLRNHHQQQQQQQQEEEVLLGGGSSGSGTGRSNAAAAAVRPSLSGLAAAPVLAGDRPDLTAAMLQSSSMVLHDPEKRPMLGWKIGKREDGQPIWQSVDRHDDYYRLRFGITGLRRDLPMLAVKSSRGITDSCLVPPKAEGNAVMLPLQQQATAVPAAAAAAAVDTQQPTPAAAAAAAAAPPGDSSGAVACSNGPVNNTFLRVEAMDVDSSAAASVEVPAETETAAKSAAAAAAALLPDGSSLSSSSRMLVCNGSANHSKRDSPIDLDQLHQAHVACSKRVKLAAAAAALQSAGGVDSRMAHAAAGSWVLPQPDLPAGLDQRQQQQQSQLQQQQQHHGQETLASTAVTAAAAAVPSPQLQQQSTTQHSQQLSGLSRSSRRRVWAEHRVMFLPLELTWVLPMTSSAWSQLQLLPSIVYRIDSLLQAARLHQQLRELMHGGGQVQAAQLMDYADELPVPEDEEAAAAGGWSPPDTLEHLLAQSFMTPLLPDMLGQQQQQHAAAAAINNGGGAAATEGGAAAGPLPASALDCAQQQAREHQQQCPEQQQQQQQRQQDSSIPGRSAAPALDGEAVRSHLLAEITSASHDAAVLHRRQEPAACNGSSSPTGAAARYNMSCNSDDMSALPDSSVAAATPLDLVVVDQTLGAGTPHHELQQQQHNRQQQQRQGPWLEVPLPSPTLLLLSMTSCSCCELFDLERLEFLGDVVLKALASICLYQVGQGLHGLLLLLTAAAAAADCCCCCCGGGVPGGAGLLDQQHFQVSCEVWLCVRCCVSRLSFV